MLHSSPRHNSSMDEQGRQQQPAAHTQLNIEPFVFWRLSKKVTPRSVAPQAHLAAGSHHHKMPLSTRHHGASGALEHASLQRAIAAGEAWLAVQQHDGDVVLLLFCCLMGAVHPCCIICYWIDMRRNGSSCVIDHAAKQMGEIAEKSHSCHPAVVTRFYGSYIGLDATPSYKTAPS